MKLFSSNKWYKQNNEETTREITAKSCKRYNIGKILLITIVLASIVLISVGTYLAVSSKKAQQPENRVGTSINVQKFEAAEDESFFVQDIIIETDDDAIVDQSLVSPSNSTTELAHERLSKEDKILMILSNITDTSNPHSITALNWMITNDPLEYCIQINNDCNDNTNILSAEKVIQRYIITLLYHTLSKPTQSEDECNWHTNIKCKNGYITSISLPKMNLTSTIPHELSLLTNLQKLELNNNNLHGTIPHQLYNNLYYLDLSYNELTGSIVITKSSSLEYLYLNHNKLQGSISNSIKRFNKLHYLWLQSNALTGNLPQSLFDIHNLTSLILYDNKLTGTIPRPIKKLQYLTYADFSYNQLSGKFNRGVFESRSLQYLYLNHNMFYGTIPTITKQAGNYSKLHHLWLNANRFSGDIPSKLGRLNHLAALLLQENHFEGSMPIEVCNLRSNDTQHSLKNLEADCDSGNYTVDCSCCTLCV